jgi:hypothetical protein
MVAVAKNVNLKYVFGLLAIIVIGFLIKSVLNTKSGMSSGIRTTSIQGASGGGSSVAQPAAPMGQNEQYQTVDGIQGTTKGLPSSCNSQPLLNAEQLLPKDNNTQFQQLNPQGGGALENISLLQAGYHNGIDTIGSSLRNSNLQVRSEPPNPTSKVSPWMNSTIEPDLMRTPLELGCGTQ